MLPSSPVTAHSRTMADMVIVSGDSLDSSVMSIPSDDDEGEHPYDQLLPPPTQWFEDGSCSIEGDGAAADDLSTNEADPLPVCESFDATFPSRMFDGASFDEQEETIQSSTPDAVVPGVSQETHRLSTGASHGTIAHDLATPMPVVRAAPSWKDYTSKVLPAAAQELLSSSLRRVLHTARLSYARGRWHRRYSDLGHNAGGYFTTETMLMTPSSGTTAPLPRFSCLTWVDRQLVQEWRTVSFRTTSTLVNRDDPNENEKAMYDTPEEEQEDDEEDDDFDRARTLIPQPSPRPTWRKADVCHACHKPFGPTLLRHHCRMCGKSYCHADSAWSHRLPHLGYDPQVPERVCDGCKRTLLEENLAERVAWRLARCRDFDNGTLTPYFETGIDTVEDAAIRLTHAAIAMARSIPLGAQAHVAVETVEVLRRHGLNGIYTLILRNEFLEAADLLCKALGINKTAWPLSVHELSAAIFYALAQHRAMRGMSPEREHLIHTFQETHPKEEQEQASRISPSWTESSTSSRISAAEGAEAGSGASTQTRRESTVSDNSEVLDETDVYDPKAPDVSDLLGIVDAKTGDIPSSDQEELPFSPVCDPVPSEVISSLLFYAPIALNFIYATKEVDMQLLAAQQGWRLLYAHLEQDPGVEGPVADRPASALFVHEEQRIACLGVRGTATINDVVTDIRQMPVPFPETESDIANCGTGRFDDDWTTVFKGQGLAVCGMARAAANLYRENIDVLVQLAEKGYRIRITGHSLGGGVATLLGALVLRHFEQTDGLEIDFEKALGNNCPTRISLDTAELLRVTAYGTPSCVDAKLSEYLKSFVTTVVLHDDVVPRLTPTSIRGLLKHLLHIRETWVRAHLADDLMAITERARSAWAPRWRQSFTLSDNSAVSIKRYCRKQIQYGKRKLLSVKGKLVNTPEDYEVEVEIGSNESDSEDDVADMILVCDRLDQSTRSAMKLPNEDEDCPESQVHPTPEPALLVDYMGGVDIKAEGIVIDGDEFFDTTESLVESDGESVKSELSGRHHCEVDVESLPNGITHHSADKCETHGPLPTRHMTEDDSWVPFDENSSSLDRSSSVSIESGEEGALETDETSPSPSAVILEETPLPRMFLPGKVVHIYTHRGGYKAAYVPRAFRELRRISLAGNMLSDHLAASYFEALLEVRSVRNAQEGLPRWTAFDEDHTCSCCASRFTWASTSDTEAQEARDKHNCRSCGTLVCNPCSTNRVPLPTIGITVAVRVCDRCYNDIGGVLSESFGMPDGMTENVGGAEGTAVMQPERQRERRSRVVDELASRIQLTCS